MSQSVEDYSNLASLPLSMASDESIIQMLKDRHSIGSPYTRLGSRSLVTVNPGSTLDIMNDATAQLYAELGYKDTTGKPYKLAPHIYEVATKAYHAMRRRAEDQTVIISGLSGSGKSETLRAVVSQLSLLAKKSKKEAKLHLQLQQAQLVLEHFCNAKTLGNNNASLSNCFQELQYNERGRIVGCKWLVFGLQKHRVSGTPANERSFHVFYEFLSGASGQERQLWKLRDPISYHYLRQSQCFKITGVDDAFQYNDLCEGLRALGMKAEQKDYLFGLLAAILHLGDLEFQDQGDQDACQVTNYQQLELCAEFLGVSPSALSTCLTYQTKLVGSELCTVFLSAKEAAIQRDMLSGTLYSLLVGWLVEWINQKFCKKDEEFSNVITLLDSTGFRQGSDKSKKHPSEFESFCSNFVAERIQNYVIRRFTAGEDFYQGYDSAEKLLRGGLNEAGFLTMLEKETNDQLDATQLGKKLNRIFASNPSYVKVNDSIFGIMHQHGQVNYSDSLFLRKNNDVFPPDFVNLVRNSQNNWIVQLFEGLSTKSHPRHGQTIVAAQHSTKPSRQPSRKWKTKTAAERAQSAPTPASSNNTILEQLDNTLNELFDSMNQQTAWLVFCIKPSEENAALMNIVKFDQRFVKQQIKGLALLSLVNHRIQHVEYVVSYDIGEFAERYASMMTSMNLQSERTDKERVQALLAVFGWTEKEASLQNEKVFLTEATWKHMEDHIRQAEKTDRSGRTAEESSIYGGSDVTSIWGEEGQRGDLVSEYGGEKPRSFTPVFPQSIRMNPQQLQDEKEELIMRDSEQIEGRELTRQRKIWLAIVRTFTCCIPTACIRRCGGMSRQDVQLAWREKVTLCMLILLLSLMSLALIVVLPFLLCPPVHQFSPDEFKYHQGTSNGDDLWMGIYGKVYDVSTFARQGHGASSTSFAVSLADMQQFGGQDVSYLFPMPLTESCKGLVNNNLVTVENNMTLLNSQAVHYSGPLARDPTSKLAQPNWFQNRVVKKFNRKGILKGDIAFEPAKVLKDALNLNKRWAIIGNEVFDLTYYFITATNHPVKTAGTPNYNYLGSGVEELFSTYVGQDVTELFKKIKPESQQPVLMSCLRNTFKVGIVDTRKSIRCQVSDYLLLGTAVLLVLVILVKFLSALQLGSRRAPEDQDRFVICQVPCYTEGEDSLRKTIDSLAALSYDDKRKLLFIIADGMIVGGGNDRPTPRIVLDILGVDPAYDPEPLAFKSIAEGSKQLNYGKVYSGLYAFEGHVVPYLVVVKVGKPSETSRPGNRGKRDSQIVLLQFLNRVHRESEMCPLELEIYHQMKNVIGVHPSLYEYILMVDADTEVMPDSLNRLVSCMLHDQQIMGICGETKLQEEDLTWATMIQVYEYFISHHMAKAFESLFGSVTCLPGCFSMYRILQAGNNRLLIAADDVVRDYSENQVDTLHKKNLLHLGEDRYLTTLMLKYFPQFKMTFTPDAVCRTAAPEKWSILLSQRRRWINSTVHNLFELMLLPDLCGFCCFSMRFVVFFDLFGTLVQPSMMLYLVFLIYKVIDTHTSDQTQGTNLVSLVIIASVYGLQALIFLIKRQWQHIGWMVIYLLATPVFSFLLPLYSFWHFDDFSWGNTRIVLGENNKVKVILQEDETFNPKMIPMKKWAHYEQELWESTSSISAYDRPLPSQLPATRITSMISSSSYALPQSIRGSVIDVTALQGPTDEELFMEIRKVIQQADLMHITKKQVREHLSATFGVDLTKRKDFINQSIELVLQERGRF